jgi:hypothetical protein
MKRNQEHTSDYARGHSTSEIRVRKQKVNSPGKTLVHFDGHGVIDGVAPGGVHFAEGTVFGVGQ